MSGRFEKRWGEEHSRQQREFVQRPRDRRKREFRRSGLSLGTTPRLGPVHVGSCWYIIRDLVLSLTIMEGVLSRGW